MPGCAGTLTGSVERDHVSHPRAQRCSKLACSTAVLSCDTYSCPPGQAGKYLQLYMPVSFPRTSGSSHHICISTLSSWPGQIRFLLPFSHSCSEPCMQLSALFLSKAIPLHPLPLNGTSCPLSWDLQPSQRGHTDMLQAPCLSSLWRWACDRQSLTLQPLLEL